MLKSTPGPWFANGGNHSLSRAVWNTLDGDMPEGVRELCVCGQSSLTDHRPDAKETDANMRLIAAAPDLLEACQDFATAMRDGEKTCMLKLINALHKTDAAIARATGQKP